VVDRLSLHFCVTDPASADEQTIERAPLEGSEVEVGLTPMGPYGVRLEPSPFGRDPVHFSLVRRAVPKRGWPDHASFRRDLWASEPQAVSITIEGG